MDVIKHYKKVKQKRANWNQQFQAVGKWVSQVKQDFEGEHEEGDFLNEDIFDSTGTFAAHNASSALLGLLWPSKAEMSIDITVPSNLKDPIDEELKWFEEHVTPALVQEMDREDSGLSLALDEYMLDQYIFGTSGIGVFYEDGNLQYKAYGVKEMHIAEGAGGFVDDVTLSYKWGARRIVGDYGLNKVSEKVRKAYESGSDEEFEVVITYRMADITGADKQPVETHHVEVAANHELRKSGFDEFPIFVGRYRKLLGETYGRSPAMQAISDIVEINVLREAVIVASEKSLDPPLGVLNDGMLGGGIIDTSAGAINVFDVQGNFGGTPPVFPINTVGEFNYTIQRINDLRESIAQHFGIDRLLDFNNETQMTATETRERSGIRKNSLSSQLNRQITEVLARMVQRSFNLMLRNDRFGYIQGDAGAMALEAQGIEVKYIPERIAKLLVDGDDAYKINFTTPASRIASDEEAAGMIEAVQFTQGLSQTHPEARHWLNIESIYDSIPRLLGTPKGVINTGDEAEELIKQEQQAQQQQIQLEQAQQLAETAKTANEIQPETA